jgi:hypothetical protein
LQEKIKARNSQHFKIGQLRICRRNCPIKIIRCQVSTRIVSSKVKSSSTLHDQNDKRKKKKITGIEGWLNFQAPSEVHHEDHCHPGTFFSRETDK